MPRRLAERTVNSRGGSFKDESPPHSLHPVSCVDTFRTMFSEAIASGTPPRALELKAGLRPRLTTQIKLSWPLNDNERELAKRIDRIVIPIGPYRNLTTLTAAIFALHPECVVLNHAAVRILPRPELDFLRDPQPKRRDAFVKAAVRLLQGGHQGYFGGSILLSHAFEQSQLRDKYLQRYGAEVIKPGAHVLFWKDSMRILNYIWSKKIDIEQLIAARDDVRLVLPIRNPISCANSNLRTGYWDQLVPPEGQNFSKVLDRILDILRWGLELKARHSDRMIVIWEDDSIQTTLTNIANMCDMAIDQQWADDLCLAGQARRRTSEDEEKQIYQAKVEQKFDKMPPIRDRLLSWV